MTNPFGTENLVTVTRLSDWAKNKPKTCPVVNSQQQSEFLMAILSLNDWTHIVNDSKLAKISIHQIIIDYRMILSFGMVTYQNKFV